MCCLDFDDLKRLGVVMKRAVYFITCRGKMMYRFNYTEDSIMDCLIDENRRKAITGGEKISYKQLTLFDMGMTS